MYAIRSYYDIGDGWHQNYGKMARARLAVVSPDNTGYSYNLIEDIRGETDVSQIEVADINGDRLNEVLVSCNNFMRIYKNDEGRWLCFRDTSITGGSFAVGNIAGDRRKEVIVAGRKYDDGLSVFDFGRLPFKDDLGKEVITETVHPRITSYNVCYTKLLRMQARHCRPIRPL